MIEDINKNTLTTNLTNKGRIRSDVAGLLDVSMVKWTLLCRSGRQVTRSIPNKLSYSIGKRNCEDIKNIIKLAPLEVTRNKQTFHITS